MNSAEFKEIREGLKLTPEQMAKKLGVSFKVVMGYENGTERITDTVVKYLNLIYKFNKS